MTSTLLQALELLDQLQPVEQAQLLEHLSRRVARQIAAQKFVVIEDSWTRLEAFRRDMEALGDAVPDFGAQLDADRKARLMVAEGAGDVHH